MKRVSEEEEGIRRKDVPHRRIIVRTIYDVLSFEATHNHVSALLKVATVAKPLKTYLKVILTRKLSVSHSQGLQEQ